MVLCRPCHRFLFAARQRIQRNDFDPSGFDRDNGGEFLFAARQRVQRNIKDYDEDYLASCVVSIRCSSASTAEPSAASGTCSSSSCAFLFAARQRVQRNGGSRGRLSAVGRVSIRCSSASTAEPAPVGRSTPSTFLVSIRCSSASTAELARPDLGEPARGVVSIRCSSASTAEQAARARRPHQDRFYSLLVSEYSGTWGSGYLRVEGDVSIRCSSASTAELVAACGQASTGAGFYSLLVSEYSGTRTTAGGRTYAMFLFAARQRVQRNQKLNGWTVVEKSFYSLLVSEYSGTLPLWTGL